MGHVVPDDLAERLPGMLDAVLSSRGGVRKTDPRSSSAGRSATSDAVRNRRRQRSSLDSRYGRFRAPRRGCWTGDESRRGVPTMIASGRRAGVISGVHVVNH